MDQQTGRKVDCKAAFKKNNQLFTESKTNIDRTLFSHAETKRVSDKTEEQRRRGEWDRLETQKPQELVTK